MDRINDQKRRNTEDLVGMIENSVVPDGLKSFLIKGFIYYRGHYGERLLIKFKASSNCSFDVNPA